MRFYEGDLRPGSDARFAIVASRWNARISEALVAGARKAFADHGLPEDRLDVVRVPGAWEIPQAIARMAGNRRHVAYVALGCVIRGETRHYEHVADGCAQALMHLSLEHAVPVVNGVLAVDDAAHAEARAGGSHGNKGEEAAMVAMEMADLFGKFA